MNLTGFQLDQYVSEKNVVNSGSKYKRKPLKGILVVFAQGGKESMSNVAECCYSRSRYSALYHSMYFLYIQCNLQHSQGCNQNFEFDFHDFNTTS